MKKLSDNLQIEVNRINNEIIKRNDDLENNKRELESTKFSLEGKINNLRENKELELIEAKRFMTEDLNRFRDEFTSKSQDIILIKKEIEKLNEKLTLVTNSLKEDIIKLSQSFQIQINTLTVENKRLLEEMKSDQHNSKIENLNLEEKLKEEISNYQKEFINELSGLKSQFNVISEDINKITEISTALKVDTFRNKILLEDKLNTVHSEYQNELKKNIDLLKLEIDYLKNDESKHEAGLANMKIIIEEIATKVEIRNSEYSNTFKSLMDSLQIELSFLERDLRARTELAAENKNEIAKAKKSLEENIFILRNENIEIRKIVNNIKIYLNNLDEELIKYENTYTEKFANLTHSSFDEKEKEKEKEILMPTMTINTIPKEIAIESPKK